MALASTQVIQPGVVALGFPNILLGSHFNLSFVGFHLRFTIGIEHLGPRIRDKIDRGKVVLRD